MTIQKVKILYVDDEENNLISFKASFRNLYDIHTAKTVIEAYDLLAKDTYHIILADQRMPQITGVQFFEKIRILYPNPLRILITGYTDINAAIDAINKGEVFRFLYKPWDENLVENVIQQAYQTYRDREELIEKNIQLEKAYEELDRFVYSASHDLRAPLMSILGITNLALMEPDVQSQNEYLELISQSVKKMDIFILNIIDYYKNERGTSTITAIDFHSLIDDSKLSIQYLPEFTHFNINTHIVQSTPFFSDLIKLRMIFNNLITNAVKFQNIEILNPKLDINITVTEKQAEIIFDDNGKGIRDEDIKQIFTMFYRADESKSGSGIGLYIVNEAVKKLGGQIWASSEFEKGTHFKIIIPSSKLLDI
jgi:two-component system sensor histidine kinase/response regulator